MYKWVDVCVWKPLWLCLYICSSKIQLIQLIQLFERCILWLLAISLAQCPFFSLLLSLSLSLEQTNSETKLNSVLTPVTNKLRYKMEMIFRGNSPAQFKWELIGTFLLHSPFRVYFIDALETFVPLGRLDQYASVWMENVIWKMRQKLRLTFKLIISIDI